MKTPFHPRSLALSLVLSSVALVTVGCGGMNVGFPDSVVSTQVKGPAIVGSVFGGHAPVVGSHIYLLQPGTAGIGSLATSILGNTVTPAVTSVNGYTITANTLDPNIPNGITPAGVTAWNYETTDANGAFDLTGAYTWTAGEPVFLYAYGGNAGTVPNSASTALAVLGNCPKTGSLNFGDNSNTPISYIYMNEVSTIAAAYVFQPFTSASNNSAVYIGSTGTTQGLVGIENAASTAAQLYDIQGSQTCQAPPSTTCPIVGEGHIANYQTQSAGVANSGNGIVPQATIDTLANIIAACVDGATGPLSTSCTSLFANATANGLTTGTQPTDTATAAINIARYPAGNYSSTTSTPSNFVTTIYNLGAGTVPYTPHLTAKPNDFTIAINYPYTNTAPYQFYSVSNPDLLRAESLSIDKAGNIWITGQGNLTGGINPTVIRWSPLGAQQVSKTSPYIYGYVSVDGLGNAWTGNAVGTTGIEKFNANGVLINTFPTTGGGYTDAYTVVADNTGNAFFFASDTGGTQGATYNTNGAYQMWEYNSAGVLQSSSPSCNGNTGPFVYYCTSGFILSAGDNVAHGAIEAATSTTTSPGSAGHLWVTSEGSPYQIARVTPAGGKDFSFSTNTEQPEYPSLDRNGVAWIANQAATGTIYKIAIQGTTPFYNSTVLTSASTGANLTWTFGSAVDGNNNVWFVNRCGNYGGCGGGTGINSIIQINGSNNLAISPPTNYIPESQYYNSTGTGLTGMTTLLNDSLNVAIDPSGNVWVTNYIGNSVVELVGAAAPVVTPLSAAAGTNMLGTVP
jgi:hypothetical protein